MPSRNVDSSPVSIIHQWNDDTMSRSSFEIHDDKKLSRSPIPTRSVRFAENNEVRETIHVNDMTDEELFAAWYDEEDYALIKKSIRLTVFLMEGGKAVEGKDHTARGLECRTAAGAKERYMNRRTAYTAVLDEQDRQWEANQDDDEKLAKVYLRHSAQGRIDAVLRARQDQDFVKAHLRALRQKRLALQQRKQRMGGNTTTCSSRPSLSQRQEERQLRGVDQPPQLPTN